MTGLSRFGIFPADKKVCYFTEALGSVGFLAESYSDMPGWSRCFCFDSRFLSPEARKGWLKINMLERDLQLEMFLWEKRSRR